MRTARAIVRPWVIVLLVAWTIFMFAAQGYAGGISPDCTMFVCGRTWWVPVGLWLVGVLIILLLGSAARRRADRANDRRA